MSHGVQEPANLVERSRCKSEYFLSFYNNNLLSAYYVLDTVIGAWRYESENI